MDKTCPTAVTFAAYFPLSDEGLMKFWKSSSSFKFCDFFSRREFLNNLNMNALERQGLGAYFEPYADTICTKKILLPKQVLDKASEEKRVGVWGEGRFQPF